MQWRRSFFFATVLLTLVITGCARRAVRRDAPVTPTPPTAVDSVVRVAIAISTPRVRLSSTAVLSIVDGRSGTVQGSSRARTEWDVRPVDSDGIEITSPGARTIVTRGTSAIVRADTSAGFVVIDGRRFRGTLTILRQGDNLLVVNNVAVEDYLKGVVPLEIGARSQNESAAIAAQAVSARSFTYARLAVRRRDANRLYDLVADVSDQAYGGVDSELELASAQLRATAGLVLKFGGRVIEAVYSSSCGGNTADAAEAWPFGGQPYLTSVSDSIPGGRGTYCDIAPRFSWSAALNSADLIASLDTYMRNYVSVNGRINWVAKISAGPRSPSGRIKTLAVTTNAGRHEVTGDKIRFVLRSAVGEILRSTKFDMSAVEESGGGVIRFEARGTGYGHGVGMCQWGAIGRARAGQDFRQILGAYYSGTRVERIDAGSE